MSDRRLEALQWFAFLAAPLAWAIHLVLGYYLAEGRCEATRWSTGWSMTEITLTAGAALIALTAEGAAATVVRELRHVGKDAPGPNGRRYFLAVGALVANVLFLTAILLAGVGIAATQACRPA